jgi:glycosyltransferase involved in cell wall biosynthesis
MYARERFFRDHLVAAVATLTDSEDLADKIALRYGVDRDRLLPMPFSPAPFVDQDSPAKDQAVFELYGLERGYFFYPAQFWAHKNHIRILQALALLNEQATRLNVVLAGGNQGNLMRIEHFLRNRGLDQQVRLLGFVPAEHMPSLYRGCRAVLMPTYFGPTNLPPLEAWIYGVPLVYSHFFARQVGDAALLIDPDDASDLASAMKACLDPELCAQLSSNGKARLKQLGVERTVAESKLLELIRRFELRLQCWQE